MITCIYFVCFLNCSYITEDTKIYGDFHACFQRKMDKEVCRKSVDSSNGILMPYYDHDTKIVYLAGKVRILNYVRCIDSFIQLSLSFRYKFNQLHETF